MTQPQSNANTITPSLLKATCSALNQALEVIQTKQTKHNLNPTLIAYKARQARIDMHKNSMYFNQQVSNNTKNKAEDAQVMDTVAQARAINNILGNVNKVDTKLLDSETLALHKVVYNLDKQAKTNDEYVARVRQAVESYGQPGTFLSSSVAKENVVVVKNLMQKTLDNFKLTQEEANPQKAEANKFRLESHNANYNSDAIKPILPSERMSQYNSELNSNEFYADEEYEMESIPSPKLGCRF